MDKKYSLISNYTVMVVTINVEWCTFENRIPTCVSAAKLCLGILVAFRFFLKGTYFKRHSNWNTTFSWNTHSKFALRGNMSVSIRSLHIICKNGHQMKHKKVLCGTSLKQAEKCNLYIYGKNFQKWLQGLKFKRA